MRFFSLKRPWSSPGFRNQILADPRRKLAVRLPAPDSLQKIVDRQSFRRIVAKCSYVVADSRWVWIGVSVLNLAVTCRSVGEGWLLVRTALMLHVATVSAVACMQFRQRIRRITETGTILWTALLWLASTVCACQRVVREHWSILRALLALNLLLVAFVVLPLLALYGVYSRIEAYTPEASSIWDSVVWSEQVLLRWGVRGFERAFPTASVSPSLFSRIMNYLFEP